MTTTEYPDPNEDLIGKKVTVEGVEYTVEGSVGWSVQYVSLISRYPIRKTCLQAKLIRNRL
ncbi:MAG: hypothetical protein H0U53_10960 [Actinobacteria bacterium]|nr:hypothetical protein [Actinomycetota bacterium]